MQLALYPSLALMVSLAVTPSLRGADAGLSLSASRAQAIFDTHCLKCHGTLEHKSGLELDTIEGALHGNEDGPVIAPGHPEKSKLIAALLPDADPHMPPKKQLSPQEIAALRTWIAGLKSSSTTQGEASRRR